MTSPVCSCTGMMTQLDASGMPQVSTPMSAGGVTVVNNSAAMQSQKLQQQRNDRLDVSDVTSIVVSCFHRFVLGA